MNNHEAWERGSSRCAMHDSILLSPQGEVCDCVSVPNQEEFSIFREIDNSDSVGSNPFL